jgi:hypothetical protein
VQAGPVITVMLSQSVIMFEQPQGMITDVKPAMLTVTHLFVEQL